MERDGSIRAGAAAGALVVVLFVAAALIDPPRPNFDAPGSEVARFYSSGRSRIGIECALLAAAAPLFVWFLVTVRGLARSAGGRGRRAAETAFACGLVWLAVFLFDVTTLAVGALRPRSPDVALALQDLEWLSMGIAAFLAAGLLAAFALLALSADAVWPRWVGWLAAIAAPLYALRIGTLFTTEGPFAADGLLGLYVPVVALAGWLLVASVVLERSCPRQPAAPAA